MVFRTPTKVRSPIILRSTKPEQVGQSEEGTGMDDSHKT